MAQGGEWTAGGGVPWTVAWSGEASFGVQPSTDFPGFQEVVQIEKQGWGTPIFAAMHVTRHRRAIFGHLCHVCGQPTPKSDRHLFPLESGGMVPMGDGTVQYGGSVPPVHAGCAQTARSRCPHLSGFAGVTTPFPEDEGRVIYRTDIVPGMEALAKSLRDALGTEAPIIFTCYRLYGPTFTAEVLRLQAEHGVHRP